MTAPKQAPVVALETPPSETLEEFMKRKHDEAAASRRAAREAKRPKP